MKNVRGITRDVPQHWVGDGFPVRSLFSYVDGNAFDPFLLLDYAGPHSFDPSEERRGVGEHPHRGFETVTIVYEGELEHRDSGGNRGTIGPGDVQWMTAASGVVHEEFHGERFSKEGGTLEMTQLWVNLPASEKGSQPRYQEIPSTRIPTFDLPDGAGALRVIAGAFDGRTGPAHTVTPIHLWELRLAAGRSFELPAPDGWTTLLVVRSGSLKVDATSHVSAVGFVEYERTGAGLVVEAIDDASALVLAGEPIGEPVVGQGPFVMNTREQIREAIVDYQSGRMGSLD